MSTKKLEKVLEYLIAGKDDKAKDLLHNIFIEKARAIHEDLMNLDDDIDGDDMDNFHDGIEHNHDDLESLSDEIEAEETMAEDEGFDDIDGMGNDADDAMDMDDDGLGADVDGDMDADVEDDTDMLGMDDFGDDEGEMDMGDAVDGDVDVSAIESSMSDLEDALAQLKAEFEKLEADDAAGDDGDFGADDVEDDNEVEASDDEGEEDSGEEADDEGEEEADDEGEEEEMDESWLAEFDDLDESLSLEKVSMPGGEGEIGAGHYAPVETNKKSPIAKAPGNVLGAKPVKTGEGPTKSGYNKETAPSTKGELPHTGDNRRKKSTDKMSKVSKEGDNSAKLNKGTSDGFGEPNKTSPLSKSPRK